MFDNRLTNRVKLAVDKGNLTSQFMKEETINIRDFLRNYRTFVKKKKTIFITNHGIPEMVVIPYRQWTEKKVKRMPIREALKGLTFKGGDPDLSEKIDEILYDNFIP
jgi:hypothetical protein